MGSWVAFRDTGNHLSCLKGLATLVEEQREEQRTEAGGRTSGREGAGKGGQSLCLPAAFLSKSHSNCSQFRNSPGTLLTMA